MSHYEERLQQDLDRIHAELEAVKNKVGQDEMKNIPFGAVAMFGYVDKLSCGLQQFMAGARKFQLNAITRSDLMASNQETAKVTSIPFMTEAQHDRALEILQG